MIIHSRKDSKYIPSGDHTRYMNKNGQYVPSVTTIIKVIPKDSLIYWANNLGWKRKSVKKELETAASIGTYVHDHIEKIIQYDQTRDEKYDLDKLQMRLSIGDYRDEVKNSLNSFIGWYRDHRDDIELIAMEKTMCGDFYGGTLDMVCYYKGKQTIIDFKTSGDFYFSMFIQLAAYVGLYEEETNEKIEDVAVLRVDKKSGERAKLKRLSNIKNGDIEYYKHVFNQCLNLYNSIYLLEKDWK